MGAGDGRYPSDWCEREVIDRDGVVATAVEVPAGLYTLPTLEELCPPTGKARSAARGGRAAAWQ
ncbi:hypothetical protein [Actinomadura algeriensis]|uniref:Uncharacterized protein n=1 Tax=Actinomadura algeriensis TaxID=1679523 RepID=A0ABR9JK90_9ACTN|nr:hypothetical protein [Actinomadura algeriensis]MBE1530879.1 hypothetical protein [Actinomadura algeriensis]